MTLLAEKNPSASACGRTGKLGLVGVGSTTKRGIEVCSQYDNYYSSNTWLVQEHTSWNFDSQEEYYGKRA